MANMCSESLEGESPTPPRDAFEEPPEVVVNERSTERAVIEEDTAHFNYMLERSQHLWKQDLDADDFCKLAATTMRLIEMRRRMMLLPTERERSTKGMGSGFFGAFGDPN